MGVIMREIWEIRHIIVSTYPHYTHTHTHTLHTTHTHTSQECPFVVTSKCLEKDLDVM